jgi:nitroreductase
MLNEEEGDTMEAINIRRSVREYKDRPVEPEKIERLLRAAMQAPSAADQRAAEFLAITDKAALEQLSKMSPYSGLLAKAPLAVILLGNTDKMKFPENWEQDLGAAAENLMLEAVELGLGTVWLGTHPDPARTGAVVRQFSLPENLKPYAVISVGYPARADANRFVDRWDPKRVHFEKI